MDERFSIIINSFHLFQWTLFNKGFVVEGGILKEQMKTNKGEGSSRSLWLLWKKLPDFLNSKQSSFW